MRTLISEEYGVYFTVKGLAATEDIDARLRLLQNRNLYLDMKYRANASRSFTDTKERAGMLPRKGAKIFFEPVSLFPLLSHSNVENE